MAGVTQLLQVLWHQFEAGKRQSQEIFEPRFFHALGPTVRFCFLLSKIVLHMIDFHIYNTVHIFTVNKKKTVRSRALCWLRIHGYNQDAGSGSGSGFSSGFHKQKYFIPP